MNVTSNAERLVRQILTGEVWPPLGDRHVYRTGPDGQPFALPGMGRTLIAAISSRDYPLVQGITVVSGLFVIVVNLVVDLSYGILDPRIRLS